MSCNSPVIHGDDDAVEGLGVVETLAALAAGDKTECQLMSLNELSLDDSSVPNSTLEVSGLEDRQEGQVGYSETRETQSAQQQHVQQFADLAVFSTNSDASLTPPDTRNVDELTRYYEALVASQRLQIQENEARYKAQIADLEKARSDAAKENEQLRALFTSNLDKRTGVHPQSQHPDQEDGEVRLDEARSGHSAGSDNADDSGVWLSSLEYNYLRSQLETSQSLKSEINKLKTQVANLTRLCAKYEMQIDSYADSQTSILSKKDLLHDHDGNAEGVRFNLDYEEAATRVVEEHVPTVKSSRMMNRRASELLMNLAPLLDPNFGQLDDDTHSVGGTELFSGEHIAVAASTSSLDLDEQEIARLEAELTSLNQQLDKFNAGEADSIRSSIHAELPSPTALTKDPGLKRADFVDTVIASEDAVHVAVTPRVTQSAPTQSAPQPAEMDLNATVCKLTSNLEEDETGQVSVRLKLAVDVRDDVTNTEGIAPQQHYTEQDEGESEDVEDDRSQLSFTKFPTADELAQETLLPKSDLRTQIEEVMVPELLAVLRAALGKDAKSISHFEDVIAEGRAFLELDDEPPQPQQQLQRQPQGLVTPPPPGMPPSPPSPPSSPRASSSLAQLPPASLVQPPAGSAAAPEAPPSPPADEDFDSLRRSGAAANAAIYAAGSPNQHNSPGSQVNRVIGQVKPVSVITPRNHPSNVQQPSGRRVSSGSVLTLLHSDPKTVLDTVKSFIRLESPFMHLLAGVVSILIASATERVSELYRDCITTWSKRYDELVAELTAEREKTKNLSAAMKSLRMAIRSLRRERIVAQAAAVDLRIRSERAWMARVNDLVATHNQKEKAAQARQEELEQLLAAARDALNAMLASSQAELKRAADEKEALQAQVEDLTQQLEARVNELVEVKNQHLAAVQMAQENWQREKEIILREKHESEEEWERKFNSTLTTERSQHAAELEATRNAHAAQIQQLERDHEMKLLSNQLEQSRKLSELEKKHSDEIAQLRQELEQTKQQAEAEKAEIRNTEEKNKLMLTTKMKSEFNEERKTMMKEFAAERATWMEGKKQAMQKLADLHEAEMRAIRAEKVSEVENIRLQAQLQIEAAARANRQQISEIEAKSEAARAELRAVLTKEIESLRAQLRVAQEKTAQEADVDTAAKLAKLQRELQAAHEQLAIERAKFAAKTDFWLSNAARRSSNPRVVAEASAAQAALPATISESIAEGHEAESSDAK